MTIKNTLLLIGCCLFWAISSVTIHANTPFKNTRHDINLSLPNEWQEMDTRSSRIFEFRHQEGISTITVTVHTFSEAVTMNTFKKLHITSRYDGWQNLFERPGSEVEAERANVDESYVAVYSKNRLDKNLQIQKMIVGEYYYLIGEKKGYVISILSPQSTWAAIQVSARQVVDSFWVGDTDRPGKAKPISTSASKSWSMIGNTASNTYYTHSSFNLGQGFNKEWSIEVAASSPNDGPPVISDEHIYISRNGELSAINRKNGESSWQFKLNKKVATSMIYNDGLLYVIVNGNPAQLYALKAGNGNILYQEDLGSQQFSHPILSQNHILVVDQNTLKVFDASTGDLNWDLSGISIDTDFYPVASNNAAIIVHDGNTLSSYDIKNGQKNWDTRISDVIMTSPMIIENTIIVMGSRQAETGQELFIQARQLHTGAHIWTSVAPKGEYKLIESPVGNTLAIIVLIEKIDGNIFSSETEDILIALDPKNGQTLWQHQKKRQKNSPLTHPMMTSQITFFSGSLEDGKSTVHGIDPNTGESIPHRFLNDHWNDLGETIYIQAIDNELVLLHKKEGKHYLTLMK